MKDIQLLVELYKIFSPSYGEEEIALLVCEELDKLGIEYKIDMWGQIYRLIPDTVLLAAHMDQVSSKIVKNIFMSEDGEYIFGDGNLGADDKNGVWILLNLLKKHKNISFIFSVAEEAGCRISEVLTHEDNKEIIKKIKYGLVFDRRGSGDIIGTYNNYCNNDLEDDLEDLGKNLGFTAAMGSFSDCDYISQVIPCVNISCGYYKAHTQHEFTSISELKSSLMFGNLILSTLTKIYSRTTPLRNNYVTYYNNILPYHIGTSSTIPLKKELSKKETTLKYCVDCDKYFFVSHADFNGKNCIYCKGIALVTETSHISKQIYEYDNDEFIYLDVFCPACENTFLEWEIEGDVCPDCGSSPVYLLEKEQEEELQEKNMIQYLCKICHEMFYEDETIGYPMCPLCSSTTDLVKISEVE
uniref:Putative peptidase n=1 Tax=viral metagenome TaxID=1070528 RepID=A0A6H1ZE29_9ZZZZ